MGRRAALTETFSSQHLISEDFHIFSLSATLNVHQYIVLNSYLQHVCCLGCVCVFYRLFYICCFIFIYFLFKGDGSVAVLNGISFTFRTEAPNVFFI